MLVFMAMLVIIPCSQRGFSDAAFAVDQQEQVAFG
jgi:hypothetical protein